LLAYQVNTTKDHHIEPVVHLCCHGSISQLVDVCLIAIDQNGSVNVLASHWYSDYWSYDLLKGFQLLNLFAV